LSNVQLVRFRPPDRNRFRRRFHFRASARFGRDLAADRLTPEGKITMNDRFLINRRDAKVMGVAAGLSDYTGVDPTLVRLGFIALVLLTGPLMILLYVLAGLLAPAQ